MKLGHLVARLAAAAAGAFLALLLADQLLGLLGYPTERVVQVAHPANHLETRRNIEFSYDFSTNSQGLRYADLPLEKQSSAERRVVVLGDSFTEGIGVPAEATFSSVLERALSTTDRPAFFINGGLAGTGPLEYGRLLFHVGLRYDPDGVLLVLYANDLQNTHPDAVLDAEPGRWRLERRNTRSGLTRAVHGLWPRIYTLITTGRSQHEERIARYDRDAVEVAVNEARHRGLSEERISSWRASLPAELVEAANADEFQANLLTLGLLEPDYWVEGLDVQGEQAERKWAAMTGILSDIVAGCNQRGLLLALVFAPSPLQYEPGFGDLLLRRVGMMTRADWAVEESEIEQRLGRWTETHAVPFLNLTPYFRQAAQQHPGTLQYPLDGHWTAQGHQLAGTIIARWLRDRELFGVAPSASASSSAAPARFGRTTFSPAVLGSFGP